MFEDIFHRRKLNIEKLQSFGFEMRNGSFEYTVPIMNEAFLLTVLVTKNGNVDTRLVVKETDEPYVLYKTSAAGSFVGEVRTEIGSVLSEIAGKCFDFSVFKNDQTLAVIDYVRDTYGVELEYLWEKFPDNAVWRRKDNQKWYGAILTVSGRKLGLPTDEILEIIDLRLEKELMEQTIDNVRYFPGWHMSKKWASKPILDETTGEPLRTAKGKPVLRKSYSVLQDDFFEHMRSAGYDDVERGERGSSEEHLTVTQFKTEREQERLAQLQEVSALAQVEADKKNKEAASAEKKAAQARAKLDDVAPLLKGMEKLAADFSDDPERTLPEAGPLESAKSYREKKAKPLWEKIVKVLRSVYRAYFDLKSKFERLQSAYDREVSKNGSLSARIYEVCAERDGLKGQVRDYERVRRAIGPEQADRILEAAYQQEQVEKEQKWGARSKIRVGAR